MKKRSKKNQTCHDISVRKRAVQYEANGWDVLADIPEYDRPPVLRANGKGAKPDLIVQKGKRRKIIEVETPETRFRDKPQHRILREFGRNHKNTEVNVRTCYF